MQAVLDRICAGVIQESTACSAAEAKHKIQPWLTDWSALGLAHRDCVGCNEDHQPRVDARAVPREQFNLDHQV